MRFYTYNNFGEVSSEMEQYDNGTSITPASASSDPNGILTKNPFRYRGYYYDNETGYYYLNAWCHDSAAQNPI